MNYSKGFKQLFYYTYSIWPSVAYLAISLLILVYFRAGRGRKKHATNLALLPFLAWRDLAKVRLPIALAIFTLLAFGVFESWLVSNPPQAEMDGYLTQLALVNFTVVWTEPIILGALIAIVALRLAQIKTRFRYIAFIVLGVLGFAIIEHLAHAILIDTVLGMVRMQQAPSLSSAMSLARAITMTSVNVLLLLMFFLTSNSVLNLTVELKGTEVEHTKRRHPIGYRIQIVFCIGIFLGVAKLAEAAFNNWYFDQWIGIYLFSSAPQWIDQNILINAAATGFGAVVLCVAAALISACIYRIAAEAIRESNRNALNVFS